jgi:hypothetical protein
MLVIAAANGNKVVKADVKQADVCGDMKDDVVYI